MAQSLEGSKRYGKTWTVFHHSRSEIDLDNPAEHFHTRKLAELISNQVVEGETRDESTNDRKSLRFGMEHDTQLISGERKSSL